MKRVKSVGPHLPFPFVPEYLVLEDETIVRKNDQSKEERKDFELPNVLEVPDDSWIGVQHSGQVDVFALSGEGPWRAKESERCVISAQELSKANPLKSVEILRRAANLVGLDIPLLVQGLESRRLPGETLEQAFDRLKKSSG